MSRPFLKWAGGKGALLPQLAPLLPGSLEGGAYVEPFMGSAAFWFGLARARRPRSATLLDTNPALVNTFVQVRDAVDALLPLLAQHDAAHNGVEGEARKAYYYAVRAQDPSDPVQAAARFLYLNRTCFNGLHRLNSQGRFNVPMGRYKRPRILNEELLRAASAALAEVRIEQADFRELPRFVGKDDFVYLDPPYAPLSPSSSFTAYAKDSFGDADQEALRDLLLELPCRWMLSNSSAPLIEALYDRPGLRVHRVAARRSINSKADSRGAVVELVVTNYRP